MNRQPKLKLVLLAFAFFFNFTLQAQSSYEDYSYSEKTYKYREDFDGSSVYWDTDEPGRRTAKIVDGYLDFRSLNDKTQVKYRTIDVDWSGNWELEIGVTWAGGKETSAVDFIWDKESGNSNKFHFGFTGSGKYVIAEYKNSAFNHIAKFIPSSYVYKSSRNILTVRKVGQTYYLFFNRRLVKTMNYKPVKGDMIGFTVPPGSRIKVDHLYAFELENKSTSTRSTNTRSASSSASGSYSSYGSSDKTQIYREDFNNSSEKWEVYRSGSRMGKIQNGFFDWISMNNNAQLIWHTLSDMDWDRDWQIETRVKFVTGKPNSSNDLVWNIDENGTDKFHFGFTGEGKYVFSKKVGSDYNSIVPFTASSTVNKSSFNKITVRKVGSVYYYFFNEKLLTTKYNHKVTSNKVGFMVAPNTTIQIDYLDISYLKSRSTTTNNTKSGTLPAGKNFVGVMTKYNGYSVQRWRTRDNFPKDEVKKEWDNGYYISDVSYDNSKWSLVMSKGTGYTNQRWITRKEWPKDEIKEKWNEDYYITELNYGNGVWAIVFSKGSGYSRQRWSTRSSFPSEKIKEFGDEGQYITEIVYGNDRWALVSSKDSDIRGQKWFKRNEFPESEINTYLNQGYSITQLSYEKDLWILVMTKYISNQPQQWFTSKTFPKDQIREYWDEGYYLTDITYGTTGVTSGLQRVPESQPREFSNLDQLLVGRWFGGSEGDTEAEKGYMIFDGNHTTTMIANGETIGGNDYEVEGTKVSLTYAVDETTSPKNFDLIFKIAGTEFGRMKGIIKFIDEDTFQLHIASEIQDPRPTRLDSGSKDVATFKRVK
ncbi:MAG: hypothetical protein HEP71_32350 [Roseivirga sp.]|nr:hypothetical protein [Roseivirga sp.]